MSGRKLNPRRKVLTEAGINRALDKSTKDCVSFCWAVMFTVLLDKHNLSVEELQRLWQEVENLSDSITQGYVNVSDLKRTLHDEYNINLVGGTKG